MFVFLTETCRLDNPKMLVMVQMATRVPPKTQKESSFGPSSC